MLWLCFIPVAVVWSDHMERARNVTAEQNGLLLTALRNQSSEAGQWSSGVDSSQLLLVVAVVRHGERSPVYSIPTPGAPATRNPIPADAQLTSEGVRQMYDYGQFMRRQYQSLYDDGQRLSSQRVLIISSHTDRTVTSAEALAAGLVPADTPFRRWASLLGNLWTPVPVYAQPKGLDSLLYGDNCPAFNKLRSSISDLPIARLLQEELKDFKQAMMNATGLTKYDFIGTSASIEDAVRYGIQYPESGSLPPGFTSDLIHTLERVAGMRMHLIVSGNGDRQRTRFKVGRLLDDVFRQMDAAINQTSPSSRKMVLYSAHDENVAGVLAALGLFNYTLEGPNFGIPEFTASVIFELFKNGTVRILFKNKLDVEGGGEPIVLKHLDCDVFCPLAKLKNLLVEVTLNRNQWETECRNDTGSGSAARSSSNAAMVESNIDLVKRHLDEPKIGSPNHAPEPTSKPTGFYATTFAALLLNVLWCNR